MKIHDDIKYMRKKGNGCQHVRDVSKRHIEERHIDFNYVIGGQKVTCALVK
jgi:hypothetical protein